MKTVDSCRNCLPPSLHGRLERFFRTAAAMIGTPRSEREDARVGSRTQAFNNHKAAARLDCNRIHEETVALRTFERLCPRT